MVAPKANKAKELPNGKSSEKTADDKSDSLADARLFATWDWEAKDFRVPIVPGRRGRVGGTAGLGPRPSITLGHPTAFGGQGR